MKPSGIGSAFVVTAALAALTGCGGGSGGSSSAEAAAKASATSFIAALRTKNAANICKYVSIPANASVTCVDGITQELHAGGLTGNPTVATAVVSGNHALVVATGKFCLAATCISNTDPNADLPTGGTTFDQAYAAVQKDPKSPDLNLVKSGSTWLVAVS